MIYNNLSNKILLLFNEQDYNEGSYVVKELFFYGCPTENIKASGEIVDNQIVLQLNDGRYTIEVVKDGYPDLVEEFIVYYNELPNVLEKVQEAVCPCNTCHEKSKSEITNSVFYTLGFLQNLGMMCEPNLVTEFMQEKYQELKNEESQKKYYGNFKFDYDKYYKDILIRAYIELYKASTDQLKDTNEELGIIQALYNLDYMDRCLYSLGYNIDDIVCKLVSRKNCGC